MQSEEKDPFNQSTSVEPMKPTVDASQTAAEPSKWMPVFATAQEGRIQGVKMFLGGVAILAVDFFLLYYMERYYLLITLVGPLLTLVGLATIVAPVTEGKRNGFAKTIYAVAAVVGLLAGFGFLYLLNR